MATIDNYLASVRHLWYGGNYDEALEAVEHLKQYMSGNTAGTMAEEYDRTKDKVIDEMNAHHSSADLDDDPVNPAHYMSYYKDGIDCITAMKHAFGNEAVVDFCLCNVFKYIWRHMSKNGKTDISKAIWYLNKYLELNK